MELAFRETRLTDVDALFEVRGRTRENPPLSDRLGTARGYSRIHRQSTGRRDYLGRRVYA